MGPPPIGAQRAKLHGPEEGDKTPRASGKG